MFKILGKIILITFITAFFLSLLNEHSCYRCENACTMDLLQKYAGKDASHKFNSTPHSLYALQLMETFLVGNYSQAEQDLIQVRHCSCIYLLL